MRFFQCEFYDRFDTKLVALNSMNREEHNQRVKYFIYTKYSLVDCSEITSLFFTDSICGLRQNIIEIVDGSANTLSQIAKFFNDMKPFQSYRILQTNVSYAISSDPVRLFDLDEWFFHRFKVFQPHRISTSNYATTCCNVFGSTVQNRSHKSH